MTHVERVLQLLSDNQPHSHLEGYRLGVMLHSRVADLRKQGYTIKCWHEDGQYLYQLFGTVREGEVATEDLAVDSALPHGLPLDTGGPPEPSFSQTPESAEKDGIPSAGPGFSPSGPAQLTVWEAA